MSPGIIRNAIIISIRVIFICIKPRRLPYPRYQNPIYGIFPIITPSSLHHSITPSSLPPITIPKKQKIPTCRQGYNSHPIFTIGGCPVPASVFRSGTARHKLVKNPDSQCHHVGWIILPHRTSQDIMLGIYDVQFLHCSLAKFNYNYIVR